MGASPSTQLRRGLESADARGVERVLRANPLLLHEVGPSFSYGEAGGHDTPLHVAARNGLAEAVARMLTVDGCSPNSLNSAGNTAVHEAVSKTTEPAQGDRDATVHALLTWRCGRPDGTIEYVNVNAVNAEGNTALHDAARNGLGVVVDMLVLHGAYVYAEDASDRTPSDVAYMAGHTRIGARLEGYMVYGDHPQMVDGFRKASLAAIDAAAAEAAAATAAAAAKGSKGAARDDIDRSLPDTTGSVSDLSTVDGDRHSVSSRHLDITPEDIAARLTHQSSFRTLESPAALLAHKERQAAQVALRLGVDTATAEALLLANRWDVSGTVAKFFEDPVRACEAAHVPLPARARSTADFVLSDADLSALSGSGSVHCSVRGSGSSGEGEGEGDAGAGADSDSDGEAEVECCVCMEDIPIAKLNRIKCGHAVCNTCWVDFLETCIAERNVQRVECPAYKCGTVVPPALVEKLLPEASLERFREFRASAFVDTNAKIKWCPATDCALAVASPYKSQARTVMCEAGHSWCWQCQHQPHEPCNCEMWARWNAKITRLQQDDESAEARAAAANVAASLAWLGEHTKVCPQCKTGIEKNSGCNHMTCKSCHYEFCWMCLGEWRIHGSGTGGFYECNRVEQIEKARASAKDELRNVPGLPSLLSARLAHCVKRYANHQLSEELERALQPAVAGKMAALQESTATRVATAFLGDAVQELLADRVVLRNSYAFLFFLSEGFEKQLFLELQGQLEQVTERLSELLVTPVLRTPRKQMIRATALAKRMRLEFVGACRAQLTPGSSMLDEAEDLEDKHTARMSGGATAEGDSSTATGDGDAGGDGGTVGEALGDGAARPTGGWVAGSGGGGGGGAASSVSA